MGGRQSRTTGPQGPVDPTTMTPVYLQPVRRGVADAVGSSSDDDSDSGSDGAGVRPASRSRTASAAPPPPRVLPPSAVGNVLAEWYRILPEERRLGRGHYGLVRRAEDIVTRRPVAVKTIQKAAVRHPDMLRNEVAILRKLKHPNIVKLYDAYEDDEEVNLVLELCNGGELYDRITARQRYDEKAAAVLIKALLRAVKYIHDNKVVHRDLKPENFLFTHAGDDAVVKIIDFGLSCEYEDGVPLHSRVGTPYYIAPEVLDQNYSKECDLWSMGVIMYIVLCGYPPFWGDRDQEIFRRVRLGNVTFDGHEWSTVSDRAKDLIAGLLTSNPKERLTAAEALRHPWIRAGGAGVVHAVPVSSMAAMHRFSGYRRLKQIALFLVVDGLHNDQMEELQEVFDEFSGGREPLDANAFRACLNADGCDMTKAEANALFSALDVTQRGTIGLREFCAACVHNESYLGEAQLYETFQQLDSDGTGFLDWENVQEVALCSKEAAQAAVEEARVDKPGLVTYGDFLRTMYADEPAPPA